jgi:hypothetical protein
MGSGAIYEEMHKFFPIYEEAVSNNVALFRCFELAQLTGE